MSATPAPTAPAPPLGAGDADAPTPRERLHTVAAACLGWLFSAMDVVLLLLVRDDIERDLGIDRAALDTAIGAGLVFSAVGAVLFAQLGDRVGRARALSWAILIYSGATACMAFAWDAWSLTAFRAISGIGTGGEWSLGFALVSEVWRAERRGTLGGLVQSMFNVGTILGVLLAMGFGGRWRLVFGLTALPALAVVYIRRRVPESRLFLRWRAARAAGEVPPDLAAAFARPPLRAIFTGRVGRVTWIAALLFTLMNYAFFMFGSQITAFARAPLAEGGLGFSRTQAGPLFMVITLAAGLSAVTAGWLSDRLGRRAVFSGLCLLGTVGFAGAWFLLPGLTPDRVGALYGLLALIGVAYGINGVVGALFSELYPTHLRATGPGFVSNLGKLLAGGAPLLAGALVARVGAEVPRLGWAAALAAPALFYAVAAALVWALPRVTGRVLDAVENDAHLR